jgi:hypothetical protein
MLPYVKPNKHLPAAPLPTDAQHQLESFCVGSPGDEMRPRSVPYGGAPETTRKRALPNPVPELTTLKFRTSKFPVFPLTATNHLLSRIPTPPNAYSQTEASRSWDPNGGTQPLDKREKTTRPHHCDAPQIHASSHPLPERKPHNTTCLYIKCLDLETEHLPQKLSPITDNRKPHGFSHAGDSGHKRTQAARRPNALPQPQSERRRTPISALAQARASGRGGTNHKGTRNGERHRENGETAMATPFPTLTGKLQPSLITATPIECTRIPVAPVEHIAPSHARICWAPSGHQCELPGQSRQQPEGCMWHPNVTHTTLPTPHAPWQLPAKQGYETHRATPRSLGPGDPRGIPTHNTKTHAILGNSTTRTQTNARTRPTTHHPQAPTPKDSPDTSIATTHTVGTQGNGAHQEAPKQIGTDGPHIIPHSPNSHHASKMLLYPTRHTTPETLTPPTTHTEEHQTRPNTYTRRHTGHGTGRSLRYTRSRIAPPSNRNHTLMNIAPYTHSSTNTDQSN